MFRSTQETVWGATRFGTISVSSLACSGSGVGVTKPEMALDPINLVLPRQLDPEAIGISMWAAVTQPTV
jgi:hypothetical protein